MSTQQPAQRYRDGSMPKAGSSAWWKRVGTTVVASAKDLLTDSGPQWAAAIAYYALLSSFPLLLAIVSIAAFFVDPEWAIERITSALGNVLPVGTGQVEDIIKGAIETRQTVSLISLATLLWTGSRVFGAVVKALNIAFNADETYGFFRRLLVELVMVATVGVLLVLALASRLIVNLLANTLQVLPFGEGPAYQVITATIPALLLGLVFFLLYRYAPRRDVTWRAAVVGAFAATALFLIAQPLFLTYVQQSADYNLIYGSLAIVVILILWAWIGALILLFGGELASHVQAILLQGQSPEAVQRAHESRAPVRRRGPVKGG